MRKKPTPVWITILVCAVSLACTKPGAQEHGDEHGEEHGDEHGEHGDDRAESGAVVLTPAQIQELGIETADAAVGEVEVELEIPGEVSLNADRVAHIVPRFPGLVKHVRKRIGEPVRKGESLATVESNETLSAYSVRSLISGTVIEKHITLGEVLSDDEPAFVVADLSTVWVMASVYEKDIVKVKAGQSARFTVSSYAAEVFPGRVGWVSDTIDEETRTLRVRVEAANPKRLLKPGMFARVRVGVESKGGTVVVPASAVQTQKGEPIVFVAKDQGRFERREVTVGARATGSIQILSGLQPGDSVVTQGSFLLKSELEKAGFEAGHAH